MSIIWTSSPFPLTPGPFPSPQNAKLQDLTPSSPTKGAKPQFVEGNAFITVIPLPAETGVKSSGKGEEKSREKSRDRILKMIRKKPTVTTQEMMDSLGLSRAGVEKIVKKLKQERRISRVGPDKGGHWEVVKDQQP